MHAIHKDLLGGSLLAAFGAFVAIYAMATLRIGSLQNVGPGGMLAACGILLVLIGIPIAIGGLRGGESIPPIERRPLAAILGSIAAFGILIGPTGLVPAVIAQVVISALAEETINWGRLVMTTAILVVLAILVFQVFLNLELVLIAGTGW